AAAQGRLDALLLRGVRREAAARTLPALRRRARLLRAAAPTGAARGGVVGPRLRVGSRLGCELRQRVREAARHVDLGERRRGVDGVRDGLRLGTRARADGEAPRGS